MRSAWIGQLVAESRKEIDLWLLQRHVDAD